MHKLNFIIKQYLILVLLIVTSLICTFIIILPNIAYARTASSIETASGGTGGGGDPSKTGKTALSDLHGVTCTGSMPGGEKTPLGMYTHSDTIQYGQVKQGSPIGTRGSAWIPLMDLGSDSMKTLGDKAYNKPGGLDGRLEQDLYKNNFHVETHPTRTDGYHGLVNGGGNGSTFCDAVGIERYVRQEEVRHDTLYSAYSNGQGVSEEKTIIVPDALENYESLNEDQQQALLKNLFDNEGATGSFTDYSLDMTKKSGGGYNRKITYKVVTIRHQFTHCITGDEDITKDGKWQVTADGDGFEVVPGDPSNKLGYIIEGKATNEHNVSYSPAPVDPAQEKYTPFNLNRNGLALKEDTGEGASVSDLRGTVDNTRGITDNTAIETLDINNDAIFKLNFDAGSVFGMPGENEGYDGTTKIDTTFNAKSSDISAAKKNEACKSKDGGFRHNPTLGEGTNDISGSTTGLTSLYDKEKDEEAIANKNDIERHWSPETCYESGTYGTRAISGGNYTLGTLEGKKNNNGKGSNGGVNTYLQGKYYEYGISYKCTVSKGGLIDGNGNCTISACPAKDPEIGGTTTPNFNVVKNGTTFALQSDYINKGDRGLYTTYGSKEQTQPVLCGKFKVKTLAGAVN